MPRYKPGVTLQRTDALHHHTGQREQRRRDAERRAAQTKRPTLPATPDITTDEESKSVMACRIHPDVIVRPNHTCRDCVAEQYERDLDLALRRRQRRHASIRRAEADRDETESLQ